MRARWIIAAVLVLLGLVWIGQGTSVLPGSGFMTGDTRWALIGVVLVGIGCVVGWTALKARQQA
jgi:hypothetical protein